MEKPWKSHGKAMEKPWKNWEKSQPAHGQAFASPLLPSAFQQLHAETGVERARRRVVVAGKGCHCELGMNDTSKIGSMIFYE